MGNQGSTGHTNQIGIRSVRRLRSRQTNRRVSIGKNKPLERVSIRWCSQFPLTVNQLQRKRDEFWDTAPAFDGRVEIWNALKAATEFIEQDDYEMAQAIVDGADIILPTGTLCDCYDRLGARYQLPLYVLSEPSNLIQDESSSGQMTPTMQHESADTIPTQTTNTEGSTEQRVSNVHAGSTIDNSSGDRRRTSHRSSLRQTQPTGCCPLFSSCCTRSNRRDPHSHRTIPAHSSSLPFWPRFGGHASPTKTSSSPEPGPDAFHSSKSSPPPPSPPPPTTLHVRLSSGEDHVLTIPSDRISVWEAKRILTSLTQWPETRQRWFACGHVLPNRARLADCHIPDGFVVQVVIHSPFEPETQWAPRMAPQSQSSNITVPVVTLSEPPATPSTVVESVCVVETT